MPAHPKCNNFGTYANLILSAQILDAIKQGRRVKSTCREGRPPWKPRTTNAWYLGQWHCFFRVPGIHVVLPNVSRHDRRLRGRKPPAVSHTRRKCLGPPAVFRVKSHHGTAHPLHCSRIPDPAWHCKPCLCGRWNLASLVGRRWLRCVFPYRPCRRCRILGSVQSPTNKCALRNVHWSEPRFGHCCPNPVLQPYPQSLWGSTAAFGKHRDLGRCRCESMA